MRKSQGSQVDVTISVLAGIFVWQKRVNLLGIGDTFSRNFVCQTQLGITRRRLKTEKSSFTKFLVAPTSRDTFAGICFVLLDF